MPPRRPARGRGMEEGRRRRRARRGGRRGQRRRPRDGAPGRDGRPSRHPGPRLRQPAVRVLPRPGLRGREHRGARRRLLPRARAGRPGRARRQPRARLPLRRRPGRACSPTGRRSWARRRPALRARRLLRLHAPRPRLRAQARARGRALRARGARGRAHPSPSGSTCATRGSRGAPRQPGRFGEEDPALAGLQLEAGDGFLGWQDDPSPLRYCHSFTEEEVDGLARSRRTSGSRRRGAGPRTAPRATSTATSRSGGPRAESRAEGAPPRRGRGPAALVTPARPRCAALRPSAPRGAPMHFLRISPRRRRLRLQSPLGRIRRRPRMRRRPRTTANDR